MKEGVHSDYLRRGFSVVEKVPVSTSSPEEGARFLINRINSMRPGEEIVSGDFIPEVVNESERNNDSIKYYVIYGG